jgi:putative ABC transport system permease protein
MIKSYLRAAWRNLVHNRVYSAINIAGLAIAISACILIGLFVANERSYDKAIPNSARVYRVNENLRYNKIPQLSAATGLPVLPLLTADHSEIEAATRVFPATPWIYPQITLEANGKKITTSKLVCADTNFAQFFGAKTLEGGPAFLPAKNSIALTQSLAQTLFGNIDPLNRIITIRVDDTTTYPMAVTTIIADLPANSHLQADGVIPFPQSYLEGQYKDNYGVLLGPSYIRLRAGLDAAAIEQKLTASIHKKNDYIDLRLQPITQLHTGSMEINFDTLNEKKIDGKYLRVFIVIAIAIFLVACANFINLTIAIAAHRGKEIAVKKIMGAGRIRILLQIFTEAFLAVAAAEVLAIGLATLFLPALNSLLDRHLSPTILFTGPMPILYIAILVFTTTIAGIYPAILISAARISQALKTKLLFANSRTSLRNILVTGQFAIAIVFIVGLIVLLRQLDYMRNKDLGYSYEQVVRIPIDTRAAARLPLIRSTLATIPGVKEVTNGFMTLGGKGDLFGIDYKTPEGKMEHVSVNLEDAGTNYLRFFNMHLVAGRGFSSDKPYDEYIINESLAKLIGHKDPIGKTINLSGGWKPGAIVGVVKDFNYSSLHKNIEPLIITAADFITNWQTQLYVKVTAGDITKTLPAITTALKPIFNGPEPRLEFLDEHFRQIYSNEIQAGTLITVIGGLAIFIACLGLLSLAAFVIVRRTKEIGIRKVLGASVPNIVTILSTEFVRLVIIGFCIAAPLAGWIMHSWLEGFAYRTTLSAWIFAAAGAGTLLIAIATISLISIRAARANPVGSLRMD